MSGGGKETAPKRLVLYVAGQTPKSTAAIGNLSRICSEYAPGQYEVEVIDLKKEPQLARQHDIVAIPTLVRELPVPVRRIIGDLSNIEKVLLHLEIEPKR